jgi:hypothetical protein
VSAAPYGLLAEFATADALLAAVRCARENGCRQVDAYSPFAIEGLAEELGFRSQGVQAWALVGALIGGIGTYLLQWYTAVIDYPLNIGGRPLNSWPSFIPATFEIAILGGAFGALIAMFAANGLPRLIHPLFGAPEFDLATRNRFFLCLPASDPTYHLGRCKQMLEGLQPLMLREVAP